MKILLLSNTLNCGGAERQMVYLAKFLKRDGFSVEFVCCNLGEYYEDLLRQDGIKVIGPMPSCLIVAYLCVVGSSALFLFYMQS